MWTWIIVGVVVGLGILLCLALAVASFSFENYNEKLKKIDQIPNSYGARTLDYVNAVNKTYFSGRLQVARCQEYDDHYGGGIVALSDKTMNSNSLASLAIVSHELGHARQDTTDILRKFWRLRKTGRICGLFFMPLFIVGAVLLALWAFQVLSQIYFLVAGAVGLVASFVIFLFAIFLKWKEIKIERQASDFALEFLGQILSEDELKLCQDLLNSARLTYWATLIRTMLSWTMLTRKEHLFH